MRKKKVFFIVMGIFFGIAITSTISYVIAQTLINSKDVIYQDNSNLAADNVQDAIDGTCTKIDTRLSTIEDKLYNLQDLSGGKNFTASTSWSYTGISITFPAKSYCSVSLKAGYNHSAPLGIELCIDQAGTMCVAVSSNDELWNKATTFSSYYASSTTYYVLSKYSGNGSSEWINYSGFCAVKYK